MPAEDKDSKLGDRFEEAAEVCKDFLTRVRNLQQEVTQRDDTIESLNKKINSLKTSIDQNSEKMEETELIISRLRRENKLLVNQLEAVKQNKNLRDSHGLSKVQPSNNLSSGEHCSVNPHEQTRRDCNQINREELKEVFTSIAETIDHLQSRMKTLEKKEKDLESYIQQMSTNNPPSMNFANCGCIRNASHHRFRADWSSNYRYRDGNSFCPNRRYRHPVSTSSSSGIGTDTTEASDRSPRGRKRKFPKENPPTDGNNGNISDETGEEFHGYPTPPEGEKTITDNRRRRLSVSSGQRTPAKKPTVETLPVIVIDDSTIVNSAADQDAVASSARKMSVDDVDMYSGFNANVGPSSSSGDESDSDSDCSGEDMPPPVKQPQKKGETPTRQNVDTTAPVTPGGRITRSRLGPVVPQ